MEEVRSKMVQVTEGRATMLEPVRVRRARERGAARAVADRRPRSLRRAAAWLSYRLHDTYSPRQRTFSIASTIVFALT